jgi:serine protease AprX
MQGALQDATDAGVVIVAAAGNAGAGTNTVGWPAQDPRTIAVAATTSSNARASFSSTGPAVDIAAPGVEIFSTYPGTYATMSGTSMASPHVAGAAAILLQANPDLTPEQVRMALQSTADPIARFGDGPTAPFWQVGYGHVDLAAAIDLVTGRNWSKNLAKAQKAADARVLAEDGFRAIRSDFWTYDASRLAVAGATDQRTFGSTVGLGVTHVKVALSHPSLAVAQMNGMEYTVTVRDATGRVIATTTEAPILGAGTAFVLVDVAAAGAALGPWSFDVSGELAASDPDTLDSESLLGRMVTLQVAQLKRN